VEKTEQSKNRIMTKIFCKELYNVKEITLSLEITFKNKKDALKITTKQI
jgi:hypothetical protein